MGQDKQCRALKRDGVRCTNNAKFGGFCGVHLPQRKKHAQRPNLGKLAWQAVEAAGAVTGALELVELIVRTWQSLPFGPGPQMPREYHYLANEFGPSISGLPSSYSPFNKGPSSVDWYKAQEIYDEAVAMLTQIESDEFDAAALPTKVAQIDSALNSLWDTMQEPLRNMVCKKIGARGSEQLAEGTTP